MSDKEQIVKQLYQAGLYGVRLCELFEDHEQILNNLNERTEKIEQDCEQNDLVSICFTY